MSKNNRAARAARILLQFFNQRSLPNDEVKFSYLRFRRQRELDLSSKALILCLYMKTIRAKQANVQRDQ